MSILVIGNGLDVWHGLPTKYTDFLDFLRVLKTQTSVSSNALLLEQAIKKSALCENHDVVKQFFYTIHDSQERQFKNELLELIDNNCWVEYFLRQELQRDRWIDFEHEIGEVIRALENNYHRNIDYTRIHGLENGTDFVWDDNNRPKSIKRLQDDLCRFIRSFEIYICLCVERIPVLKRLKCIDTMNRLDKVLSFNYTNTFERLYESVFFGNPEYCYIHGKANINNTIESNKIVLGVEEYLDPEERNTNTEFIEFKKYYQRIHKQTDYHYSKWLRRIDAGAENGETYIIGHSLDSTDKDVLREMILLESFENKRFYTTKIYSYSRENNARQIEKLVRLLGYDNLNALSRGADKYRTILFSELA